MANENLIFRRQFLLCPQKCEKLKDWQSIAFGIYNLYVHPDCGLTVSHSPFMHLALIGFIIDPLHPDKSNQDILNDTAESDTVNAVCSKLYNCGGRFALLVKQFDEYVILHDACGLRSVFYTKSGSDIYVASQPLLFKLLIPLEVLLVHLLFFLFLSLD
jgi:hypothetical protein